MSSKTLDKLSEKIDEILNRLDKLEEKITSPKNIKQESKFIPFEEAFELCKEGENYPCMYLPKSGKNKNLCCGLNATLVDNEDDEQIKIDGKVDEKAFHSLRCSGCHNKGRANSESKKKCNEKIKGINVEATKTVDKDTISFLSGNVDGLLSPSRAISKPAMEKNDDIEYDDHFHSIESIDDNYFIFESTKTKAGTKSKKTPTLKGYICEEFDKDNYKDNMEEDIPEKFINMLKKNKKFNFTGDIVKEKITIPRLSKKDEKKEDKEEDEDENNIENILSELDI